MQIVGEKTNKDLFEWVREGIDRGAGEIFLTSIDNEGTKNGFDLKLSPKQVKSQQFL